MASLDTLPSDQRAVLELVLRRGRSYDQIGAMLSIDRAGVRARALAALDSLGPQTPVSAERRALITDYLLGGLPGRVADEVRTMLAQSPPERAWARVVASELEPIASSPLPEIPVEAPAPKVRTPAAVGARTEPAAPAEPGATPAARPPRRSSRLGGVVLLGLGAVIAAAVVVALVIVLSGGSSSKRSSHASRLLTRPGGQSSTTTTGTGTQVLAQVNLNPPSGGRARGIALVLRVASRTGIEIRADGLVPNSLHPPNAYAVWLYNSPSDSHILGFVNPGVGKNGQLQTAGGLPDNAAHFQKLLITLETQSNPHTPGTIVLEGTLSGLH